VEQAAVGELADVELPAQVYGSPIAAAEEDYAAGLQTECRLGDTWLERPQMDLERLSCPSSLPWWHGWYPPAKWPHS
jgi:hypothetical protein